jgi:hypothetical protein
LKRSAIFPIFKGMKRILPLTLSAVLALPAAAQEADDPGIRDGLGLLSEGSRLILEGLMDEMRPFVEDQMIPLLQDLNGMIGDVSAYHAPEILPNGDILIRRRVIPTPEVESDPDADAVTEPIDL